MNEHANKIELAGTRRPQTRYDAAIKRSAVEHYHLHKRSIAQTARELGINRRTLRGWIHPEHAAAAPPAPARSLSKAEAEILRLRTELARVSEQRDILIKSLGTRSHT